MTDPTQSDKLLHGARATVVNEDDITLLAVTNVLLRNRRWILIWMVVGGAFGVVAALGRKPTYTATASFTPQGADAGGSGVSTLAGQLGITVPAAIASQSQFYAELLKSRALFAPIVHDTVVVAARGGKSLTFLDVFGIEDESPERVAESAVDGLLRATETKVTTVTGTITVRVRTRFRSVSLALAHRVLERVNEFNVRTRQSQATEERRFVEGRLAEARRALRAAEDRLEAFLRGNRQLMSPELSFARDRLQREVAIQQQLVMALSQSYEDARIREVRDTPVITVIESPTVPTRPNSRGRALRGIAGLLLGALAGAVLTLSEEMFSRRRVAGDPDTVELLGLVREFRAGFGGLLRGRLSRGRQS